MNPIKIFTDTNCDIPKAIREENKIALINFSLYMDGKEIEINPDWDIVDYKTLYNTLRAGERIYILSTTELEIKYKFSHYLKKGYDIIYIGCSGKQSKTLFKAQKVVEELKKEYPNNKIEVLDSLNASIGQGLVVLNACKLNSEGLPFEEIIEKTSAMRKNVIQFATVETLTYLSKANRVNARSAIFGNLFKVKPILISDIDGDQTAFLKVKGREESLNKIADLFIENIINPEEQEIYIMHGDDLESALYVKNRLLSSGLKFKNINIEVVGAVIGVSTGPGMVCIFGKGKEVTFKGK